MEFILTLTISESEARALNALTVYGFDDFVRVFYEHLGKTYLEPHQAGLKLLFDTVRTELPKQLKRIDQTRITFNE